MADVLAVRDEYRAQTWVMLLQECKASRMTYKEYFESRGISEKSFYYWQRRFWKQTVEVWRRDWFRWILWRSRRSSCKSFSAVRN